MEEERRRRKKKKKKKEEEEEKEEEEGGGRREGEGRKRRRRLFPFSENPLGSIRPFPGPIQLFYARYNQSYRKPIKTGAYHRWGDYSKSTESGKTGFCFLIASQTGFARGFLHN